MKNIESADTQSTEQKIIEAAEQEFLLKGFEGARTTSIAAKAGVTHAMFHYYFRSKEKIFEKIIAQKIMMLTDLIAQSMSGTDTSFEMKLKNIIDTHIDFISENPALPIFLVREIDSNPERLQMLRNRFISFAPALVDYMQGELDRGAESGKFRKTDARMLLLDIVSLNVFPFMAAPLVNVVLSGYMDDKATFCELRKKENFDTIMRKIKA